MILHIDFDSFYASIEARNDPSLKGQAVVIGPTSRNARAPKGVVQSCTYEAKKLGIKSADPIGRVFRKYPSAIFVLPDRSYYGLVSARVMQIVKEMADAENFGFAQTSIDDCYLETGLDFENTLAFAQRIESEIRTKEGLAVSFGISGSKSEAKKLSKLQKKLRPDHGPYPFPRHKYEGSSILALPIYPRHRKQCNSCGYRKALWYFYCSAFPHMKWTKCFGCMTDTEREAIRVFSKTARTLGQTKL